MRTYDWMKFYEAAVLETDIAKRPDRVAKAQEEIRQRLAEGSAANDAAELAALDKTLAALRTLELEVLPQKDSGDEMRYPQWQGPLRDLMLEVDRPKLREKIQKLEVFMTARLEQLRQGSDDHKEQQAIREALLLLGTIKPGSPGD
jgi:hypothetical protein